MGSRIGIKARLLAVAVVPTVALVVVAADGALPRKHAAEAAGQITDEARLLGQLVTLQHALTSELAPTETTLRAATFHLSTELMNHYAGYDVAAELVQSRIAVARICLLYTSPSPRD